MSWTKPRDIWGWLLLLTPALELMLIPFVPDRWAAYFIHDEIPSLTLLIYNLFVVAAYSVFLGFRHTRSGTDWPERIAVRVGFGVVIALVNGTIAFAGCSAGNTFFHYL